MILGTSHSLSYSIITSHKKKTTIKFLFGLGRLCTTWNMPEDNFNEYFNVIIFLYIVVLNLSCIHWISCAYSCYKRVKLLSLIPYEKTCLNDKMNCFTRKLRNLFWFLVERTTKNSAILTLFTVQGELFVIDLYRDDVIRVVTTMCYEPLRGDFLRGHGEAVVCVRAFRLTLRIIKLLQRNSHFLT